MPTTNVRIPAEALAMLRQTIKDMAGMDLLARANEMEAPRPVAPSRVNTFAEIIGPEPIEHSEEWFGFPITEQSLFDFLNMVRMNQVPRRSPVPRNRAAWRWMDYRTMSNYPLNDRMRAREYCTSRGMWAIVFKTWVQELADWIGDRPVLEVMAGAGWLAKALTECGVNVIATDNDAESHCAHAVHPIEVISAEEAVLKYMDKVRLILVSWPRGGIGRALLRWHGRPVIYVGEMRGGCTADDLFFDIFEPNETPVRSFVQWRGMHDEVVVGYINAASRAHRRAKRDSHDPNTAPPLYPAPDVPQRRPARVRVEPAPLVYNGPAWTTTASSAADTMTVTLADNTTATVTGYDVDWSSLLIEDEDRDPRAAETVDEASPEPEWVRQLVLWSDGRELIISRGVNFRAGLDAQVIVRCVDGMARLRRLGNGAVEVVAGQAAIVVIGTMDGQPAYSRTYEIRAGDTFSMSGPIES